MSRDDEWQAGVRYGLGAELVTRGPRASAVFAAGSRVGSRLDVRTAAALVDTPDLAAGLPPGVVAVCLSDLPPSASVPAFDAETTNPIGWKRNHEPGTDPASDRTALQAPSVETMRRVHHVADWTAGEADSAVRPVPWPPPQLPEPS